MRQIKKRVVLFLCMAACIFSLSACVKTEEAASAVDPMLAQALGQQTQGLLENIVSIPLDQMTYVIEQNRKAGQEGMAAGLESYVSAAEELGALVSVGDVIVTETKEGYSVSLPAVFEQRECEFSIDLTEDLVNIVSMSFTPVYTIKENLAKAGMNTLMGMGIVFLVLIFISWIISCMKYVNKIGGNTKEKTESVPAPAPVAVAPAAEENLADDLELVAVITAAIAASTGASSDGLVVRSIRRASSSNWKRA